MARHIVYTRTMLSLLICPFIFSFFFLSNNFQTLQFIITLFSGTVKPTNFKLAYAWTEGGHHVYQNRAAAAYLSFISLLFLVSGIQTLIFLSHCEAYKVGTCYTWTMGGCIMFTGIRLLLLIFPFIYSFFFYNFQLQRSRFTNAYNCPCWLPKNQILITHAEIHSAQCL